MCIRDRSSAIILNSLSLSSPLTLFKSFSFTYSLYVTLTLSSLYSSFTFSHVSIGLAYYNRFDLPKFRGYDYNVCSLWRVVLNCWLYCLMSCAELGKLGARNCILYQPLGVLARGHQKDVFFIPHSLIGFSQMRDLARGRKVIVHCQHVVFLRSTGHALLRWLNVSFVPIPNAYLVRADTEY